MFRAIFIGCLLGLSFVIFAQLPVVQIDAVSVNPQTNQVQIFWTSSSSTNVVGYRIFEQYQDNPLLNFAIDTVFGRLENNYTVERNADTNFRYRIDVFDEDFNHSPITSDWKRIFLCKVEQGSCEKKLHVSWSSAERSLSNIAYFEIWLSKNDEPYTLATTIHDPLQRSAVVDAFGHEQKYKIYVRAVNSTETIFSISTADSLVMITAPEPEFAYIETINVVDDKTVEVACLADVSKVWKHLFLYIDGSLEQTITHADFLNNNRFLLPRKDGFYHFEISDTCGEIVIRSNDAKPVLLEAELQGTVVNLRFSEYQGWFGNDIHYEVFEIQDGDITVKTGLFPHQTHSFAISSIEQILNLSYYVVAREISDNPYGIKSLAKSNVVDIISRNEIPLYFPTGFVPGGVTRIYRPIYVSQVNDEMKFLIHNTFGQVVFSTTDPTDGWDGTFNNNGNECQAGVYLFIFELIRNGKTMQKKGVITLIR